MGKGGELRGDVRRKEKRYDARKGKGRRKSKNAKNAQERIRCTFKDCQKYNQIRIVLLFTFNEEMMCALAEILQVQVGESMGCDVNNRLYTCRTG